MTTMLCCTNCFADHHIREELGPSKSKAKGNCPICKTEKADLFQINEIADQFELLYSSYRISKEGPHFADWIAQDWRIFDETKITHCQQIQLVSAALGENFPIDAPMQPIAIDAQEPLAQWDELKKELKEKNRYFFDQSLINMERLSDLLAFLLTVDLPSCWFRGRITETNEGYELLEMGAPPGRLATHGRANPPGIPYLYLTSKPETAASEVRPHTGEKICIAEFKIEGQITAVDLRNPKSRVSPFILSDTVSIAQLRNDLPFIERLGEELTRPVLPKGAAIDYIPSQFLCEFIKKRGYDGVVYRSAMSDGFNFALFEPTRATAVSRKIYDIESVQVQIGESALL